MAERDVHPRLEAKLPLPRLIGNEESLFYEYTLINGIGRNESALCVRK